MGKKESRENYLLNLLAATKRMSTAEAVSLLDISAATARRLFIALEKKGEIVRNYGGIQLPGCGQEYSFESSEKVSQLEKKRIGMKAVEMVQDGDTVYLDCGTTLMQMTLALSERIACGTLHSLNIITNSIANVQALTPCAQCRVILIGGEYDRSRRDFSGPLTERYVAPFHFTKSFFGCEGLDPHMGFSSNQLSISSLNTAVIAQSDASYVLLDDRKFGKRSLMAYADLREIDGIITNKQPPDKLAQALQENGVAIAIATC